MAIAKKPKSLPTDAAAAFIEAAPDGAIGESPARKGRVYKDRKVPVSFTCEKDLLAAFDRKAEEAGVSRAALLALAMGRIVRGEI